MIRRSIAAIVSFAVAAFLAFALPSPAVAAPAGQSVLSFPLSAASATQGTFAGTLRITSFGVDHGALVASGIVTGTLVDETGSVVSVARSVTLPVSLPSAARGRATAKFHACEILHLELGPLDLDLLGLVVHLDRVVLDITAVPGAGNLLGNLLCAVTNLLNGGGPLAQIANLLHQILDLLG